MFYTYKGARAGYFTGITIVLIFLLTALFAILVDENYWIAFFLILLCLNIEMFCMDAKYYMGWYKPFGSYDGWHKAGCPTRGTDK